MGLLHDSTDAYPGHRGTLLSPLSPSGPRIWEGLASMESLQLLFKGWVKLLTALASPYCRRTARVSSPTAASQGHRWGWSLVIQGSPPIALALPQSISLPLQGCSWASPFSIVECHGAHRILQLLQDCVIFQSIPTMAYSQKCNVPRPQPLICAIGSLENFPSSAYLWH